MGDTEKGDTEKAVQRGFSRALPNLFSSTPRPPILGTSQYA
jgi:hypothetical protein